MKLLRIALMLALCLSLGACKVVVNVPDAPSSGGDTRTDSGGRDDSHPSQLPGSSSGGDRDDEDTGRRRGWKDVLADVTGTIMLGAEKGVLFYAYDTLAYPGKPVDLAVRIQAVKGLSGVRGVTVGFYRDSRLVGSAKTNKDGLAKIRYTPPRVGNYEFSARITAVDDDDRKKLLDVSAAPLLVAAHEKNMPLVVIDLDHTVVGSSFFRVLIGGARRMRDSQEVTRRVAKTYGIVYLTHRPDVLTVKSKRWLRDNGFPSGPLLVSRLKQAFGDSGKYKSGRLSDLRKSFPKVKIGIGDKLSDAQAYIDNGLTAYLIPHYKAKPKDMRKMAKALRRMKGRGRLHVVDGWREIEAGMFRRRSFPAKDFAGRLEKRAERLEEEEKRKEREDDDDDDDDD